MPAILPPPHIPTYPLNFAYLVASFSRVEAALKRKQCFTTTRGRFYSDGWDASFAQVKYRYDGCARKRESKGGVRGKRGREKTERG